MFAVVDIETTGGTPNTDRITEVAIYITDGRQIKDSFVSLVNPEMNIPWHITMLTGISNEMVSNAPTWDQVAQKVASFLADNIFVAHNVNFDYNFIKSQLNQSNIKWDQKKLCTVQFARKITPGLPSYSLGNLCKSLNVTITDRHRASGDALATTKVLHLLLKKDTKNYLDTYIKKKNASIPPNVAPEIVDNLPASPGVYYFHNQAGRIIYVGKAINLKKRVLSHFIGTKKNRLKMIDQIHNISYKITGNELVALLLESAEIKNHYPVFNQAQKRKSETYALGSYTDRNGYSRLAILPTRMTQNPGIIFSSAPEARKFLEYLIKEYNLCKKLSGIQNTLHSCLDYELGKCQGACLGKEDFTSYNERSKNALESLSAFGQTYVIFQPGRHIEEKCLILVEDGIYKGYGYVHIKTPISHIDEAKFYIQPQQDDTDIQRILLSYLSKNPSNVLIPETGVMV